MSRSSWNFLIDLLAFAAFVLLAGTGFLLEYVLPAGSGGGGHRPGTAVWGLTRHDWGSVHYWVALLLMAVLAAHLALHWRWMLAMIKGKASREQGWRMAFAVLGLIGLFALAAAPFLSPRETVEPEENAVVEIRGSMMVSDAAAQIGLDSEEFLRRAGLPEDTERTEQLGRLARSQGLTMDEVRQAVEENEPGR